LTCAESHLARLREGRTESIETSSLHLDVLRDLKRIHAHICSAAYPVLEAAGELHPSRLKDSEQPAS
jgi:phosphate:Na+ symporter